MIDDDEDDSEKSQPKRHRHLPWLDDNAAAAVKVKAKTKASAKKAAKQAHVSDSEAETVSPDTNNSAIVKSSNGQASQKSMLKKRKFALEEKRHVHAAKKTEHDKALFEIDEELHPVQQALEKCA